MAGIGWIGCDDYPCFYDEDEKPEGPIAQGAKDGE